MKLFFQGRQCPYNRFYLFQKLYISAVNFVIFILLHRYRKIILDHDQQTKTYPGLISPIIYLPITLEVKGMSSDNVVSLYSYLGLTWIIGCCMFGLVVIRKNRECFISRQNLCQSSLLLCGLTLCGATQVQDYAGNVMFGRFCIIGHFFYSNFLSLYIWSHSWWVSIFSEDVCL